MAPHITWRPFSTKTKNRAISNKVLSNELKELENYGLIKRLEFSEMPPRVEYELTTQGKTLLPILHSIADWGNSSIVINIMEEFG